MKTLGMIGGMSWESTQIYYRDLNVSIRASEGGLTSAPLLLHSLEFAELAALQHRGDWHGIAKRLAHSAVLLEKAGVDGFLIATNTMHKVVDEVCAATSLPCINILDSVGSRLQSAGVSRVGLLGTRFSMEDGFYHRHLETRYGIEVVTPEASVRQHLHSIIFDELCQGRVVDSSRQAMSAMVESLAQQGCEKVILGCTELALMGLEQPAVPLLDSTQAHIRDGVRFIRGELTLDQPLSAIA